MNDPHGEQGRFRTTHWSLIRRAAGEQTDEAQAALAELYEVYWSPVYRFIQRGNRAEEDARDSTQAFFAKLIESRDFDAVDANRGRLRCSMRSRWPRKRPSPGIGPSRS